MIKVFEVQCFSFLVAEWFLTVRATRFLYGFLLSCAGTLQTGSHPCDRRKALKIPACNTFQLELDRGRGGWSIVPSHNASHSTIVCQEPTLSLSIQLPVEITWQYWNTWQRMVPDEIRKRTWEFHGESLLPLLLLSSEVLGHLEIWHYPHVGETHPDCWTPFNGSFKLRCTLRQKASWGKCTYPVLVIGRAVDFRGHSKVLDRMCAGKEQSFWDLWEG